MIAIPARRELGAVRGDVRIPLATVTDVRVSDQKWSELRGVRAPGTGFPGVISLCTRRGPGVVDFTPVYGGGQAVVIETSGAPFDRLVVSCTDARGAALRISQSGGPVAGDVPRPAAGAASWVNLAAGLTECR